MEKKSGKKDQNSAPLTRSSSKKTIYIGPFSQKLGRHDFFSVFWDWYGIHNVQKNIGTGLYTCINPPSSSRTILVIL